MSYSRLPLTTYHLGLPLGLTLWYRRSSLMLLISAMVAIFLYTGDENQYNTEFPSLVIQVVIYTHSSLQHSQAHCNMCTCSCTHTYVLVYFFSVSLSLLWQSRYIHTHLVQYIRSLFKNRGGVAFSCAPSQPAACAVDVDLGGDSNRSVDPRRKDFYLCFIPFILSLI